MDSMFFDPNRTDFDNDYQRVLWQYGLNIVPLSVSLEDIEDEETREGCTQVYTCTMEMIEDLLNDPDESIKWPTWYMGSYSGWIAGNTAPMKKHSEEYAKFLKRSERYGFVYDAKLKSWSNEKYPLFCEYLIRLGELAKERKQNLGGYFDRRDFRLFAKHIKLTIKDLTRTLSDIDKSYCLSLHEYAVSRGMKVQAKDTTTFRYVYKKLYSLELHSNPFRIEVPYRLDNGKYVSGQFERFISVALAQPDSDELVSYIQGGVCVCNACGGTKKANQRCGRWADICGKRRLLAMCHPAIGKYRSAADSAYNDYDIKMLRRMTDIRIAQVDSYSVEN